MKNLKEDLIKSAVTGVSGAALAYFFLGESQGNVNLFNKINVPVPAAIGVATASGSLISDLSHDYLLPHINKNAKLTNIESALLQLSTSAAGTSGVLLLSGMPTNNIANAALLGAASSVVGDYVNSKFISPGASLLF